MGRPATGIMTVEESEPLSLKTLIQKGAIVKGEKISGSIVFSSRSAVDFHSSYTAEEKYLQLSYVIGNKEKRLEEIELVTLQSNLKKGEILYFVCPQSRNLCRTLYRAYRSPIWKSRKAYGLHIYYPLQLQAKVGRDNSRYWYYEQKLEHLYKQRQSYTFLGRPTKRLQRIEAIEGRRDEADNRRWESLSFPAWFQKELQEKGSNS